jgi:pimeloyl-ACP methyl ester carboxylesterase
MIRALTAAAVLAAFATVAQAAEPNPWWDHYAKGSRVVSLADGRKLDLFCEGKGAPAVVLESGLGAGALAWRNVQDQIAATTRVCSYDRSGFGRSGPATGPRDAGALADDLFQVLKAGKVAGPYVVVGHSLGGYTSRIFASRHPDLVAGLVLVDPSHEEQTKRFTELAPAAFKADRDRTAFLRPCADPKRSEAVAKRCTAPAPPDLPPAYAERFRAAQGPEFSAAMLAELDAFDAGAAILARERKPLGDKPLVVLTAANLAAPPGTPAGEGEALQAAWVKMHDDITTLSPRGVNLVVQGAGHNIQMDKPAAVITAVEGVVATVRSEAATKR